jgi:hypothetical protein
VEIKAIYEEIFKLNLNFKILTGIHLFIEFEKIEEELNFSKFKKHADTNFIT